MKRVSYRIHSEVVPYYRTYINVKNIDAKNLNEYIEKVLTKRFEPHVVKFKHSGGAVIIE